MELLPFLEDIYPENLLYAVTVRSPVAKGCLKFIQVPILPDNYTFITASDIPGENRLEDTDMPILADKRISYIGEPVALIIGDSKIKLNELAAGCIVNVDYDDVDIDADAGMLVREISVGDIHEIFETAGRIVTGSYTTGIQEHWYAEPVGAVSCWNEPAAVTKRKHEEKTVQTKKANFYGNVLTVKTATQWSSHVKRSVSRVLALDPSNISVEPTNLNLHMDGKLWYPSFVACHASLGTYITKKPVRLILYNEEDFSYSPKRSCSSIDIASAIDENGKIIASDIDISVNLGAYKVNANEILDQICFGSMGMYAFENLKLRAKAIQTNIPPQGPFSGFGLAQGLFAIERHFSQIADMIKIDPAELRLNCIDLGLIHPSLKTEISGEELINAAAKMSDYYRKWASCELLKHSRKEKNPEKGDNPRGIGIAVGYQGNGLLYYGEDKGSYNLEVTLTKDGILEIRSNINSSEDYSKIWERVASQTISIEPEMVRIVSTASQDSGPSCASRNITSVTKLVEKCCLAIRKQRFHAPLPITVRRSIKPQSGCFRNTGWNVMDINGFLKPGMAAAVVEVTIDLAECAPVIRGVWLAVDGGKIISVNRAKRSLTRSATQALGWAFTENIEYVDGIIPKSQYDNFKIFSPVEIPPIHIDFLTGDNAEAKGIGEVAFTCIPAAFLQAVSQAMDHSFKSIPLKKKDIWEMLRLRNIEAHSQERK